MKDYFSNSSDNYARFRPTYPQTIFDFLSPLLKDKDTAWDCGTGNGQLAQELSKVFKQVEATDISQTQLNNAFQADNINYSLQAAEQTTFAAESFDLITVAQAVHWFDIDKFNEEVNRVGKPNSLLCLIGYELNNITPEIDQIVADFYKNIIGPYWYPERKLIEQKYQTIPFPFRELETPEIFNIKLWKLEHLIGYLNTWSAVKHYSSENNNDNPIDLIRTDLTKAWGDTEVRRVSFPIFFRVGRIK